MTSVDSSESERIVDLVRRYLEPRQPANYRLEIVPEGVRREDDWYYVVVRPVPEDVRSYEYYGLLTEAEMELQDQEKMNVLLVPVLPR